MKFLQRYPNTDKGTPRELKAAYTHGPGVDEHLGMEEGQETFFYHVDALGSITALRNLTAKQAAKYLYKVFGALLNSLGPNSTYGFTGRERDNAEGLYYHRARHYLPAIGRFLHRDPAGMVDGPNLYAYAGNSPVNFVDPSGEFHCPWWAYSWQCFVCDTCVFLVTAIRSIWFYVIISGRLGMSLCLAAAGAVCSWLHIGSTLCLAIAWAVCMAIIIYGAFIGAPALCAATKYIIGYGLC